MKNIIDDTDTIELIWTEHSIKQTQSSIYEPKPITNQCLNCGEPVQDEASSFCSYGPESCATDYNRAMEIKKKQNER